MPPPTSLSSLSANKLKKYFSFVHSSETPYTSDTSTPNPDANISLVGPRPPSPSKPTVTVITLSTLSRHTSRELASLPLSLSRQTSREVSGSGSGSGSGSHSGSTSKAGSKGTGMTGDLGKTMKKAETSPEAMIKSSNVVQTFFRRPSTKTPQPKGAPGGPRTSMSASRTGRSSISLSASRTGTGTGTGRVSGDADTGRSRSASRTRPGSGGSRPGTSDGLGAGAGGGAGGGGGGSGAAMAGGGAAPSAFKKFEARTAASGAAAARVGLGVGESSGSEYSESEYEGSVHGGEKTMKKKIRPLPPTISAHHRHTSSSTSASHATSTAVPASTPAGQPTLSSYAYPTKAYHHQQSSDPPEFVRRLRAEEGEREGEFYAPIFGPDSPLLQVEHRVEGVEGEGRVKEKEEEKGEEKREEREQGEQNGKDETQSVADEDGLSYQDPPTPSHPTNDASPLLHLDPAEYRLDKGKERDMSPPSPAPSSIRTGEEEFVVMPLGQVPPQAQVPGPYTLPFVPPPPPPPLPPPVQRLALPAGIPPPLQIEDIFPAYPASSQPQAPSQPQPQGHIQPQSQVHTQPQIQSQTQSHTQSQTQPQTQPPPQKRPPRPLPSPPVIPSLPATPLASASFPPAPSAPLASAGSGHTSTPPASAGYNASFVATPQARAPLPQVPQVHQSQPQGQLQAPPPPPLLLPQPEPQAQLPQASTPTALPPPLPVPPAPADSLSPVLSPAQTTSPISPALSSASTVTPRPTLRRKRQHPLPPTPGSPPGAVSGWPGVVKINATLGSGQVQGQGAKVDAIGQAVVQDRGEVKEGSAQLVKAPDASQASSQVPASPPAQALHIPPPPSSPPPSPNPSSVAPPPPQPPSSTTAPTPAPSSVPAPPTPASTTSTSTSTTPPTQTPVSSHRLLIHQHAQLQRQKQREQLQRLLRQESSGPLGLASGWTPRARERTVSAGAATALKIGVGARGEKGGKVEGKVEGGKGEGKVGGGKVEGEKAGVEETAERKLQIGEPKRLRKASLPLSTSVSTTPAPAPLKLPPRLGQSVSASPSLPSPVSTIASTITSTTSGSESTGSLPAPTPPPKDRGPAKVTSSVSTSTLTSSSASSLSPSPSNASTGSIKLKSGLSPVSPIPRSPRRFIPPPPRPPPRHQPLPPPPPGFGGSATPPSAATQTPAPPPQPLSGVIAQRAVPQFSQSLPSTPSANGSVPTATSSPSRFAHLQSLSSNPSRINSAPMGRVMSVQPPPSSVSRVPAVGLSRSATSVMGSRAPRAPASRGMTTPAPAAVGTTLGPRAREPSILRPPPAVPLQPSATHPVATSSLPAPRPPPPRPIQVPPQPRVEVELVNQEETPPPSAVATPAPNTADVHWNDMVREMGAGLMVKNGVGLGVTAEGGLGGVGYESVVLREASGLEAPAPQQVQAKRRPLPPTPQSR